MDGGATKLYVEAIGAFHQHRVFLTVAVIDMLHLFEGAGHFTRVVGAIAREGDSSPLADDEELDMHSIAFSPKTAAARAEAKRSFASAEEQEDEELKEEMEDHFLSDKFDFSRNYGETLAVFSSIC
eukprot:COSAG05_NODE_15174_length_376_cov_1.281588_1_plen_125_part_11